MIGQLSGTREWGMFKQKPAEAAGSEEPAGDPRRFNLAQPRWEGPVVGPSQSLSGIGAPAGRSGEPQSQARRDGLYALRVA
jgi:hypothetical protein